MEKHHIIVKEIQSENCTQYFYFVRIPLGQDFIPYKKVLENIIKNNEYIIYEKIYSLPKLQSVYEHYKIKKGLQHPINYVFCNEVSLFHASSIIIYTIKYVNSAHENQVQYLYDNNYFLYGTIYQIDNVKKMYCLTPALNDGQTTEELIRQDFQYFVQILRNSNFQLNRTWFYIKDIDKYYQAFNHYRKLFFQNIDIDYCEESNNLPASTCIEIQHQIAKCHMEFICMDKSHQSLIKRIYNISQNEANGSSYLYQPTFSRAVAIDYPMYTELQISGTASIGENGETVYTEDAYKQIKKTIQNVNNLLKEVGMDFEDLYMATCFFKKDKYIPIFYSVLKDMGIKEFPTVHLLGHVCRDDLLFELDGIAYKTKTIN